jgi:hypothetical protein
MGTWISFCVREWVQHFRLDTTLERCIQKCSFSLAGGLMTAPPAHRGFAIPVKNLLPSDLEENS